MTMLLVGLLLGSILAAFVSRAAYQNGVTDGWGFSQEPQNPGYVVAGAYLRKYMAHRWRKLSWFGIDSKNAYSVVSAVEDDDSDSDDLGCLVEVRAGIDWWQHTTVPMPSVRCHGEQVHTVLLTDYHVANLRATIECIGYGLLDRVPRNPTWALNTGDWLGEVYLRLPEVAYPPNAKPTELAERANKACAVPPPAYGTYRP